MDRSASWDNRINPVENRLSNDTLAADDGNISCMSADNIPPQSNSSWDSGESSSRGNDDSKLKLAWFSSSSACSGTDSRAEDWSSEPSNMQNYSSNLSMSLSSNHGHVRENNCHRDLGASLPHTLYKSGESGTDQIQTFYASSTNGRTSSGNSSNFSENNDASGSSFGTWGSSSKRKSFEGTSGDFYPGGSSSSNHPTENIIQRSDPGYHTTPKNLSTSSGLLNASSTNNLEQINGVDMSRVRPGFFPSSSIPGIAENPAGNLALRSNLGLHESVPFDAPRGTSAGYSSVNAAGPQSWPISNTDTLELMPPMALSMNLNDTPNQPLGHVDEAREVHSYPWNGSLSSQGGSSSSSFVHGETNIRSSISNNPEHPVVVSAPETRNTLPEQIDWSFTPGTRATSGNYSSGSQIGPSSGMPSSSTAWLPHREQTLRNYRRLSRAAPWIPFPRTESDSRVRTSPSVFLPLASTSSDELATTSHAQNQSDQRSAAFLMDTLGDGSHGWNALAAVEGRHRLIRHILNAMRRGDHLRAEDFMLIDPFLNGFAELHDRHSDMRLDVDNMSYEELLALEERIGNVSTGLREEEIRHSMKQRKYEAEALGASPTLEPCCICQEDYVVGDDIGKLDCGHEFHPSCIEQWLCLRNLCPICKIVALET